MPRFLLKRIPLFLAIALIFSLGSSGEPRSDQFDRIDPNKELVLTDVEDIKAFFKHANTKLSLDKTQQLDPTASSQMSIRGARRTFGAMSGNVTGMQPGSLNPLGGLFGGGTTNLISAAGTLFGAAAAAGQQAIAAQQAAAAQQAIAAQQLPGTVITSITPAQQIMNMRTCPAFHPAVCTPAGQCLLAGGVSTGNCAMGLLVCCTQRQEIPQGCSATNNLIVIKDKLSTIASSDEGKSCQYEIYKAEPNVCQLQLDFDAFEMDAPLWGEDCSPDSVMRISDSVTVKNGFPLCGIHNGTRMHLAYGRSTRITLSFFTTPTSSYRVRINQIECNSVERIPDQCLQNHEGHSGLVKSFGFPQYMINNQKYTVCINSKAVSDVGKITWSECNAQEAGSATDQNFMMSEYFFEEVPIENQTESGHYYNYYHFYNNPDTSLYIPSEGFSCSKTSYVEIHGGEKHCGARFMASAKFLRSESRPYMLTVNVVEDAAENLPDYAVYRIPGLRRNSSSVGLADPLPPNDCEYTSSSPSPPVSQQVPAAVPIPSTQGFEPCKILTRPKTGNVQYDLCLCSRKEGTNLPEKPKPRPDLLTRIGFCLHYTVS